MRIHDMNWMQVEDYLKRDNRAQEMRQTMLNTAAATARDDEDVSVPPVGSQRRPDGVTVIAEKDVAQWLKEHGKGVGQRG